MARDKETTTADWNRVYEAQCEMESLGHRIEELDRQYVVDREKAGFYGIKAFEGRQLAHPELSTAHHAAIEKYKRLFAEYQVLRNEERRLARAKVQ